MVIHQVLRPWWSLSRDCSARSLEARAGTARCRAWLSVSTVTPPSPPPHAIPWALLPGWPPASSCFSGSGWDAA